MQLFLETRILTQSINLRQLLYLRHPQNLLPMSARRSTLGSRLVPPPRVDRCSGDKQGHPQNKGVEEGSTEQQKRKKAQSLLADVLCHHKTLELIREDSTATQHWSNQPLDGAESEKCPVSWTEQYMGKS